MVPSISVFHIWVNWLVRYSLYSTLVCWQVFKIHRVMPSFFLDAVSGTNFSSSPSRWHNCRNVPDVISVQCHAEFSPFLRLFGHRIRKQRLLLPSTRGFKDNYRDLETVCWKTRTCHLHPSTFKVFYLYVKAASHYLCSIKTNLFDLKQSILFQKMFLLAFTTVMARVS